MGVHNSPEYAPEVALPAATAERPFALKVVDGRPQPKLFDLELEDR
jgi:hypothetical protein